MTKITPPDGNENLEDAVDFTPENPHYVTPINPGRQAIDNPEMLEGIKRGISQGVAEDETAEHGGYVPKNDDPTFQDAPEHKDAEHKAAAHDETAADPEDARQNVAADMANPRDQHTGDKTVRPDRLSGDELHHADDAEHMNPADDAHLDADHETKADEGDQGAHMHQHVDTAAEHGFAKQQFGTEGQLGADARKAADVQNKQAAHKVEEDKHD